MRAAAATLVLLGLAQMLGDLAGLGSLRGLALATAASPAPRVFSAVDGFETYSARFFLEWSDGSGRAQRAPVDAEAYSRLRGPYNRRNVFGAVVAYGPVFARSERVGPAYRAVLRYTLCGDAPLLRELGLAAEDVSSPRIRVEPLGRDPAARAPILLDPECP